jgi:hypothetical protein
MQSRDNAPPASAMPVSVASSSRDQWAWLDALGRSFGCTILLVTRDGTPGPLVGATSLVPEIRSIIGAQDGAFIRPILKALETGDIERASMESFTLVARRLTVQGAVVGGIAIAMPKRSAASRTTDEAPSPDINTIESWLTSAVEAHLGQRPPDEEEEAFDRISSLHRLLHDAVESGNQADLVTGFAEALFAWDGVEVTGYFTDVRGQWVRGMSPPGVTHPAVLDAEFGDLTRRPLPIRLSPSDLARLGFPAGSDVLAIQIGEVTHDPWILLFAEGYRPLNQPRLNLYADLLRDALGRLSNLLETRASWAILQALLGETGDPESAVNAALREFARVLDGISESLIVTNATGTTLLMAGERESASLVRAFDRGNRLVSTVHLPKLGTMQLTVRRPRGSSFSRREHHLVDRAAQILAAWLPSALKQPAESIGPASSGRGFEAILDRAASQMTRDGLDVSMVVIVVPESHSRRELLQSWVTDIRGRLRGSDLAGAISDREIGVLLSGTSGEYVPLVWARLGESLGIEPGGTTPIGSASRQAGSADGESIVNAARQNLNGQGVRRQTRRPKS